MKTMQTYWAAFLLFAAIAMMSCPEPTIEIELPQAILLEFTVENKMDVPIEAKIRHYYHWNWVGLKEADPFLVNSGNVISYSDWSAETLESGELKAIGVEEAYLSDPNQSWTMTGFVLLNRRLVSLAEAPYFISSFEMEIAIPGGTISLAGYDTEEQYFDGMGLCYLKLDGAGGPGTNCILYTEKQRIHFEKPYILPVKLVINEDGTYSFDDELVKP